MGEKHTLTRLEAAAARALHFGAYSFASVESILNHHLESQALPQAAISSEAAALLHSNIRGAAYFDSIQ